VFVIKRLVLLNGLSLSTPDSTALDSFHGWRGIWVVTSLQLFVTLNRCGTQRRNTQETSDAFHRSSYVWVPGL